MRRVLSAVLLAALIASLAWGGHPLGGLGLGLPSPVSGSRVLSFYAGLTSSLAPSPGIGPATFTRASGQSFVDHEGVLRSVASGDVDGTDPALTRAAPVYPGARMVKNWLPNSENMTTWTLADGATATAETVTFSTSSSSRISRGSTTQDWNGRRVASRIRLWVEAGTKQVKLRWIQNASPWAEFASRTVTLTTTPTVFALVGVATQAGIAFQLLNTGTESFTFSATAVQVEDITAASVQAPGEYVKTGAAPAVKFFPTQNGNTVDGNGVVTEATGSAISPAPAGLLVEPSGTNKVTAYSTPGADQLGSELVTNGGFDSDTWWNKTHTPPNSEVTISGGVCRFVSDGTLAQLYAAVLTKGKRYTVTYTVVARASGQLTMGDAGGTVIETTPGTYSQTFTATSPNLSIKRFSGTTDVTIDNVSVKEVGGTNSSTGAFVSGLGTGAKAYHDGSAFQNPIPGLTLSGDTAATLEIVSDTAALAAAGLSALAPSGKVYRLTGTVGGAFVVFSGGATTTNAHAMSVYARKGSGPTATLRRSATGVGATEITGNTYERVTALYPTLNVSEQLMVSTTGASAVYFLAPQLEESPVVTSLIPTNGATATRAATALSYPAGNADADGLGYSGYMEDTPAAVMATGPELFAGNLTTGAGIVVAGTDATHTVTFSGAGMRYQSDTTSPALTVQLVTGLTAGKYYRFVLTFSGTGIIKSDNPAVNPYTSGVAVDSVALGSAFAILRGGTNVDVTITSVSVKEIPLRVLWSPASSRGLMRYGDTLRYVGASGTATSGNVFTAATRAKIAWKVTAAGAISAWVNGSQVLTNVAVGGYTATRCAVGHDGEATPAQQALGQLRNLTLWPVVLSDAELAARSTP